jgi:hypothetical protein
VNEKTIRLNHSPLEAKLHPNFRPGPVKIGGFAECRGEDDTVWDLVLKRGGWTQTAEGTQRDRGGVRGWDLKPRQEWQKPHPKKGNLTLEMSIRGIGGPEVPWYQIEYSVLSPTDIVLDLGLTDWADWDHRGDLVFAKGGCLCRQKFHKGILADPVQIADFNPLKFENVAPPTKAQQW